jgi:Flp pilus assembly protein TadB
MENDNLGSVKPDPDAGAKGSESRRDWLVFFISFLIVFVGVTSVTGSKSLGWDIARGVAGVFLIVALVVWFRRWRREAL